MKTKLFTILLLFIVASGFSQSKRRQLTVSMYPYIPNADNFYRKLETRFEIIYPEVDLIVKLNPDYYEDNGLIKEDADVYEIDCILLNDFISRKKIQVLRNDLVGSESDLLPAAKIAYQNNKLYAVPHWLCGNFLIYNKNDAQIAQASSLKDLETTFGIKPVITNGLLVDLKGRLTLGELYVDALMDKFKDVEVVKKYCTLATLDTTVVADLGRLTKLTYSTWGREKSYHNKNFFYQRQFAKGNGRALIGYSESLYTVLDQINNSFAKEEKPFDPANIGIKEIALSDNGSTPIGWVDALGLDAKLSGAKLMDATAFVNFCTSPEGYRLALKPDYGDAPRYLLPAFRRCFEDQEIIVAAPMYKMLLPLAERIVSVTNDGISPALMEIGAAIDALNLKAK